MAFYHILFLIFTVYILFECISYSIFEIKTQQNKFGGTCVILFSIFCVIFSNIVVWVN